jgi:small conductance mechanosensitive channel
VNGTVWYVPNGQIARVANKSQDWSRALLDVTVPNDADLHEAEATIKEVADGIWRDDAWRSKLLEEPEIWGVENLGPNSIDIRVVIKTKPAEQFAVTRELRMRIKDALDADSIVQDVRKPAPNTGHDGTEPDSVSEDNVDD